MLPAILAEGRSTLYGLVTRENTKAEDYLGARVLSTLEEALHDCAVDAVYVAFPVAMHADAAIAALRAGKHVLCEKPMAMSDAQAGKMVAEAQASGRLLGVSYYRRLYPKLIRAKGRASLRNTFERRASDGRGRLRALSARDWVR